MATLIAFFDERPSGPILDLMIFMRYLEIRLSAHAKARSRAETGTFCDSRLGIQSTSWMDQNLVAIRIDSSNCDRNRPS